MHAGARIDQRTRGPLQVQEVPGPVDDVHGHVAGHHAPGGFRDLHTVVYERTLAGADLRGRDVLEAGGVSPAQKRVLIALCRPYKDGAAFATPLSSGCRLAAIGATVTGKSG